MCWNFPVSIGQCKCFLAIFDQCICFPVNLSWCLSFPAYFGQCRPFLANVDQCRSSLANFGQFQCLPVIFDWYNMILAGSVCFSANLVVFQQGLVVFGSVQSSFFLVRRCLGRICHIPAGSSSGWAHFVVFGQFCVFFGSISTCFRSPGRTKDLFMYFFQPASWHCSQFQWFFSWFSSFFSWLNVVAADST